MLCKCAPVCSPLRGTGRGGTAGEGEPIRKSREHSEHYGRTSTPESTCRRPHRCQAHRDSKWGGVGRGREQRRGSLAVLAAVPQRALHQGHSRHGVSGASCCSNHPKGPGTNFADGAPHTASGPGDCSGVLPPPHEWPGWGWHGLANLALHPNAPSWLCLGYWLYPNPDVPRLEKPVLGSQGSLSSPAHWQQCHRKGLKDPRTSSHTWTLQPPAPIALTSGLLTDAHGHHGI